MITINDVRSFGLFGSHIPDSTLQQCLSAAENESAKYATRVGSNMVDFLTLLFACHLVSLVERQPTSVRQDALGVSYESLGGDGGLHETTYGREIERLTRIRVPKVV